MTTVECGRTQNGYLLCRIDSRCSDCPLNTPVSEQEQKIAKERDAK